MLDTKICPKCDSQMVRGRVSDYNDIYWIALKEAKIFRKTSLVDDGKRITVQAYRCQQCGFVEIYASDEGKS